MTINIKQSNTGTGDNKISMNGGSARLFGQGDGIFMNGLNVTETGCSKCGEPLKVDGVIKDVSFINGVGTHNSCML